MGIENEVSPSAGQRWSTERPTVPGWYWWRSLLGDLEIVRIALAENVWMIYGHGYGQGARLEYQGPGEWQGPITPNEEAGAHAI